MHTEFNRSDSEKILDLLREIESSPHVTQRYLAKKYNTSLGKINFLLKALLEKGLIKVKNFKNSKNKTAYLYMMTPDGVTLRFHLTQRFFSIKVREYQQLKREIEMFANKAHEHNELLAGSSNEQ